MTPEEILAHPPRVLSQAQRQFYFDNGYLHVEGLVSSSWVDRLREAMHELIRRSRAVGSNDTNFVLAPGHSAEAPRLRRVNYAADNHPAIWEFSSKGVIADLAADLVGPDVKFRESMINFKWARGGDEVKWHQDTSYPYTNTHPLQTLMSLEDVGLEQGPLMVVPGSHKGEVFDRYDAEGRWSGAIAEADLRRVPLDRAVSLTGPAGSVTVVHMHVVHGSKQNDSDRGRPLLLCGYDPADAFPIRGLPMVSRYTGEIVRGKASRYAHMEAGRVLLPPDWSRQRYTSLYEVQQGESREAAGKTAPAA